MRLEPFGRFRMRYIQGSWHRPYGGEEGAGFGTGDGEMSGTLEGSAVWSNRPRRREDGVWTPNLHGVVKTVADEEVLVSIHGQSVLEVGSNRRAILARVELTTEAETWQWLNTCFFVGEGEINEDHEEWWLTIYLCVNEEAQGPPGIGHIPPRKESQQRGRDT